MIGEVKSLRWVLTPDRMGSRSHVRIEAVLAGEPFVLYVTRRAYHDPTSGESQVLGFGRFTSEVQGQRATINGETFLKSVSVEIEVVMPERSAMPFRPLVDKVPFIAKKAEWPAYLRSTLTRVSDADLDIIRSDFRLFSRPR